MEVTRVAKADFKKEFQVLIVLTVLYANDDD